MADHILVPPERSGIELDEFLCLHFPLLGKGWVRRQVREGRVLLDGNPALPSDRLRRDQVVSVDFDEENAPEPPVAPELELHVIHESEDVLVVDKPAGLAVEPERWARGEACLSGGLLRLALDRAELTPEDPRSPTAGLGFRPRLVHRIDKDTSGAVLVAKTLEAERRLRAAFEAGEVRKVYLALVEGEYPLEDGESEVIDLQLAPDRRRSGKMRVVREGGKPSRTRVSIDRRFRGYTLLRCEPLTGRTHQIRVHLAARGFPLAVDPLYGRRDSLSLSALKRAYRPKRGRPESPLIDRLALHALEIAFPSAEGELVRVVAPPHKDLERVLKQLSKVRAPGR